MSLEPEQYQSLASFRLALRRFLAGAEAISKAAGVTQQQYQAMLAIKTWPSRAMTMGDLAEQLLLTHHAAVQLINRMTTAGVAARAPSSTDRRAVLLKLTPAGEALIERLGALHMAEVLRQEPHLTQSLRRLKRTSPQPTVEAGDEGDGS
ncbi:MAG TPA: MarR family transcriptional regulator [Caulobacteraceae bacterium]|nr:MarR family transcriptional regulator [Caulobacteraceae bacterium]